MDDKTRDIPPASNKPAGYKYKTMNTIANPMMRLFLRSPLQGMFSGSLALITYQGRKSGKEYTIPVQYAQAGKIVYIIPGDAEQKTWWRNLRGGAQVQVVLRGQNVKGTAQVLQGETDRDAIAEALVTYSQRFPAAARLHHLAPAPDGLFNPDDLRTVAASIVVVRVTLE